MVAHSDLQFTCHQVFTPIAWKFTRLCIDVMRSCACVFPPDKKDDSKRQWKRKEALIATKMTQLSDTHGLAATKLSDSQ